MPYSPRQELIRANLVSIFDGLSEQTAAAREFWGSEAESVQALAELRELIFDADEFGLAYEEIVCVCEIGTFVLKGSDAVKLLEIGLLLGYKTARASDEMFGRE